MEVQEINSCDICNSTHDVVKHNMIYSEHGRSRYWQNLICNECKALILMFKEWADANDIQAIGAKYILFEKEYGRKGVMDNFIDQNKEQLERIFSIIPPIYGPHKATLAAILRKTVEPNLHHNIYTKMIKTKQ